MGLANFVYNPLTFPVSQNMSSGPIQSSPPDFTELARASKSAAVDAAGLAQVLRRRVGGEVRFDKGSRALYATD